jgi:hypothetical protein
VPETAQGLEIMPGVLEYCLNQIFVKIIMEYDVKWSFTVSVNVQIKLKIWKNDKKNNKKYILIYILNI